MLVQNNLHGPVQVLENGVAKLQNVITPHFESPIAASPMSHLIDATASRLNIPLNSPRGKLEISVQTPLEASKAPYSVTGLG